MRESKQVQRRTTAAACKLIVNDTADIGYGQVKWEYPRVDSPHFFHVKRVAHELLLLLVPHNDYTAFRVVHCHLVTSALLISIERILLACSKKTRPAHCPTVRGTFVQVAFIEFVTFCLVFLTATARCNVRPLQPGVSVRAAECEGRSAAEG